MAMGKKQDIGDIIRDVIGAMTKPKRSIRPKVYRKGAKKPPDAPRVQGKLTGPTQKITVSPPSRRQMPRRAGDKPFDREEAILPRRPRNPRKPTGPSTRQMPKRKPKAGPKRGANY